MASVKSLSFSPFFNTPEVPAPLGGPTSAVTANLLPSSTFSRLVPAFMAGHLLFLPSVGLSFPLGQSKSKPGAFFGFRVGAFSPYAPTMSLNNPLCIGQPYAGPPYRGIISSIEVVKDPGKLLPSDPRPVIHNLYNDLLTLIVLRNPQGNLAATLCELDGVTEQVAQCLLQSSLLCGDCRRFYVPVSHQVYALPGSLGSRVLEGVIRYLNNRDCLPLHIMGLVAGHVKDVIDLGYQPLNPLPGPEQEFFLLLAYFSGITAQNRLM